MDQIFTIISQSRRELGMLAFIVLIVLFIFLRKLRKKMYKPHFNDNMPHNLWFYYEMINMEADHKIATQKRLEKTFIDFLFRKYYISSEDLKKKSYFELVREREEDDNVIELYGEIWNNIEELKHKPQNEVLVYIKSIKLIFNKGNFEDWIQQHKRGKPCNDC